jgi:hypothetical protein
VSIAKITEAKILALIFQATAWSQYADSVGSETAIAVALHLSDPLDSGNMSTFEASFGGYARQSVVRSPAGWTLLGSNISPDQPGIISPGGKYQLSPARRRRKPSPTFPLARPEAVRVIFCGRVR